MYIIFLKTIKCNSLEMHTLPIGPRMSLFSIERWSQSFFIGTADEDFPLIFLPHFLRMAKKNMLLRPFNLFFVIHS